MLWNSGRCMRLYTSQPCSSPCGTATEWQRRGRHAGCRCAAAADAHTSRDNHRADELSRRLAMIMPLKRALSPADVTRQSQTCGQRGAQRRACHARARWQGQQAQPPRSRHARAEGLRAEARAGRAPARAFMKPGTEPSGACSAARSCVPISHSRSMPTHTTLLRGWLWAVHGVHGVVGWWAAPPPPRRYWSKQRQQRHGTLHPTQPLTCSASCYRCRRG